MAPASPRCPAAQTLSSDGANQSVSATVTDLAGNSSSVDGERHQHRPGTAHDHRRSDRAANANGWYNAPVTVTFTCGDALAGVASCNAPVTVSTDGANQSVTGSATDKAGNAATATVSGINIDRIAPTITATPNDGVWRKGPVTVHFTCADDRSGVASCPADVVVSAEGVDQRERHGHRQGRQLDHASRDGPDRQDLAVVGLQRQRHDPRAARRSDHRDRGRQLSGIAAVTVTFRNSLNGLRPTKRPPCRAPSPRPAARGLSARPAAIGFFTATAVATDRAGNVQNPGTARTIQVIA